MNLLQKYYYTLCAIHTSIDQPIEPNRNNFLGHETPDNYTFMELVEKKLEIEHVGNFRKNIYESDTEALNKLEFLSKDEEQEKLINDCINHKHIKEVIDMLLAESSKL